MAAVEYRISEQDYVEAQRLARRTTRKQRIFNAVLVAVLVISFTFNPIDIRVAVLGIVGGGLIALIGVKLLFPWLARRQYREYPEIAQLTSIDLLNDGLAFAAPSGQGKLPWTRVQKWRENDGFVLIYVSAKLHHVVPKRLAQQGFDVDAMTRALREHVGAPV